MRLKHFIAYWLPLIIYTVFIFYMSSLEGLSHPEIIAQFSFKDKIFHIIEYAILSFLLLRLLVKYNLRYPYILAIVLATSYGVTDEIHQLFVQGRFFSYLDMAANLFGALLIYLVPKGFLPSGNRHENQKN